ncbi:DUF2752 domain-containing protein [Streptomyces sp. NPDC051211]|uniref:DUF2752 domain-containing protein n=1 Tax=Streptomyces sp. NPDC051211 TaxID=3154643 RepID=UPI00344C7447
MDASKASAASPTPPLPPAGATSVPAAPEPPRAPQPLRDPLQGPQALHGPPVAPPGPARRLAAPVLTLAAAAAAFAYVGAVDPNEPGHYPVCPLLRLTGVLCPGCGGLRSAHAFAHGDLIQAAGANALAVIGYFLFAGYIALWLKRAYQGRPAPRPSLKTQYWWALGVIGLAFATVRNLPFGFWPAP